MNKDFLIVPPKNVKISEINKILDFLMSNKKIKISSNNYIIIGDKIIFDIDRHFIKGRIFTGASDEEIEVINQLINHFDDERIYMHFYGCTAFIKNKKIKTI